MKNAILTLLMLCSVSLVACKKNDALNEDTDYSGYPRTSVPKELISPTKYWQLGILASGNFYDSYNSTYKDGAGGTYLFYDFNEDGTFTALMYLKATSSYGETRQSWTETKGTLVVGDTTISGNNYKTISLHPATGTDRMVVNYGSETKKKLTQSDFKARTLLKAKYICGDYVKDGKKYLDLLRIDEGPEILFSLHEEY